MIVFQISLHFDLVKEIRKIIQCHIYILMKKVIILKKIHVANEVFGSTILHHRKKMMLLWVMEVGFDNTCTVSGKWNVSRVIPRLYGWLNKTVRLSTLVVEHFVEVMTAGSQLRRSQIESYGQPMAHFRFMGREGRWGKGGGGGDGMHFTW